jgi:hypothetical protein
MLRIPAELGVTRVLVRKNAFRRGRQRRDLAASWTLRRPSLIFCWFSGLDSSR